MTHITVFTPIKLYKVYGLVDIIPLKYAYEITKIFHNYFKGVFVWEKIPQISFETKAAIVLAYERGEGSIETPAKRFGSHPSSITKWIMMYSS